MCGTRHGGGWLWYCFSSGQAGLESSWPFGMSFRSFSFSFQARIYLLCIARGKSEKRGREGKKALIEG